MDIPKMIAELRVQLDQLNSAILVLEQLAGTSGGKRRGRPPAWMTAAKTRHRPSVADVLQAARTATKQTEILSQ